MTEEKMILMLVKQTIADLEEEDRDKVEECVKEMRILMEKHGDHATMAMGLLGAEVAAE